MAAILTTGSAATLISCAHDDNPVAEQPESPVTDPTTGPLASVWYAETLTDGTVKDAEGTENSYSSILERYHFESDGTGRWSRYYLGDDPYPVNSEGGIGDGDFTYTVGDDGRLDIKFNNSELEFLPSTGQLTYANNQLTSGETTFNIDVDKVMEEACAEWDDLFHMGAEGDNQQQGSGLSVQDGSRIFGVGFGYNYVVDHSRAVSKNAIMRQDFIDNNDLRKTEGVDADIDVKSYTANSLDELSNELAANANVKGGSFGFKGEVGAAFEAKYKKSSEHEYALSVINVALTTVTLQADLAEVREHLTPTFKLALLGILSTYKGEKGLYNLINDYGTHFICRASLGGRVRCATTVDLSKVSGEYDLNAYANVSYSNMYVNAKASVSDNFKKSYENNTSAVHNHITAIGGTPETVLALSEKPDTKKFEAWRKTLAQDNYKNTCVVSVKETYNIWELLNEYGGKRAKEIETYVKDGGYERDIQEENNFQVGAIGKISNVSGIFTKDDISNGTLVKNLEIDGDIVARACLEYIPQLNSSKQSIVIYPVVNNIPKYNLGYFIGNESQYPQRVCWNMASTTPTFIKLARETKLGAQNELYILGCSFLHKDIDEKTIQKGQVRPVRATNAYMASRSMDKNGKAIDHDYPLVKMFNRVWTRENLNFWIDGGYVYKTATNDAMYYRNTFLVDANYRKRLPSGWRLPRNTDFNELVAEMKARNIQQPALQLATGGIMGFNAPWLGYYDLGSRSMKETNQCVYFWAVEYNAATKDKPAAYNFNTHWKLKLNKRNGNVEVIQNTGSDADTNAFYNIRMIEDVTW